MLELIVNNPEKVLTLLGFLGVSVPGAAVVAYKFACKWAAEVMHDCAADNVDLADLMTKKGLKLMATALVDVAAKKG